MCAPLPGLWVPAPGIWDPPPGAVTPPCREPTWHLLVQSTSRAGGPHSGGDGFCSRQVPLASERQESTRGPAGAGEAPPLEGESVRQGWAGWSPPRGPHASGMQPPGLFSAECPPAYSLPALPSVAPTVSNPRHGSVRPGSQRRSPGTLAVPPAPCLSTGAWGSPKAEQGQPVVAPERSSPGMCPALWPLGPALWAPGGLVPHG